MSQLLPGFSNITKLEQALRTKPEKFWTKRGEKMALNLFHQMSRRVPAYKAFLAERDIKPSKIKTIADLNTVPMLDKDNYLKKYPRADLCWDGKFGETAWVISSTSGSTGLPYYFPRQIRQDNDYALTAELYLRTNFNIQNQSTLYIDAFAMGVWIGGVFTYEAIKTVAERGNYALSIITPGINKAEIIKAVHNLGKDFDQIIIGSYPPFLKDILDEGHRAGLNWKNYNIKFVFSAEGFTESFRDYVIETVGISDPFRDTLNHYGTVDLGTMSYETPLAVYLRRLIIGNESLYDATFGQIYKLPTLTQYLPEMFYFQEESGNLLCTSPGGIPLIRYDLKDHGGVIPMTEIEKTFGQHDIDFKASTMKAGIADTVWNLPFVHVYERSDFSVSFLGFQVYPEPVRKALHEKVLADNVTGKFTMTVEYDEDQQQNLVIHVELKRDVDETPKLRQSVNAVIVNHLLRDNPIYNMNYQTLGERVLPRIIFWEYEHTEHFGLGGKQKWVKK